MPSKIAWSEWLLSRLTKGKSDLLRRFVSMGGCYVKEAKQEMAGSGTLQAICCGWKVVGF